MMQFLAYAVRDARDSAQKTASGKTSPRACIFAQDAAEICDPAIGCLARPTLHAITDAVVAGLPQGPGTYRLNRYPSPDGRRGIPKCAPHFFRSQSTLCEDKRSFAHIGLAAQAGFDGDPSMASCGGYDTTHNTRGSTCVDPSHRSLSFWRQAPLRPAAALCPNRLSSVRARGLARRRFSTVTFWQVPRSARRAMSPIVRPSRIAADSGTTLTRPQGLRFYQEPSALLRAGGFLYSKACVSGRRAALTP